ncbi:MAG: hypothetical protein ABFS08_12510 [Pseudomonadota bacterium]
MNKLKFVMAGLISVSMLYGCGGGSKSVKVSAAAMASPVVVTSSVAYGKRSGASDKVKKECIIDKQLPDFIEQYASKNDIAVVQKDGKISSKGKGKVLVVEFDGIVAGSGGAFTGPKAVTVKGALYKNGKKIGSFEGRRTSGGGAVFGYKGTCSILGRCVKALGKDIADWLARPTMNARLGEM